MLKKFLIFTKKNQIKLTYHEKIIFLSWCKVKVLHLHLLSKTSVHAGLRTVFVFVVALTKKKRGVFEKYSMPVFAINDFASRRFLSIYEKKKNWKKNIFPIASFKI